MRRGRLNRALLVGAALLTVTGLAVAASMADIRNTKHNFSALVVPSAVNRTASASTESQICAFCHTPHGATDAPKAPLWNRQLSGATYIPYSSTSIDATDLGQPGGKSKLCLSCHDGTIALGSVNVLNRVENPQIGFTGTQSDGTIPEGPHGASTGFTRRLGVDLRNDHPISFTFDAAQAARDTELYTPATVAHLANRDAKQGIKPTLPLEDNKVECISCHDPHVRSDVPGENIKFLRVNRFQQQPPVQGQFDAKNDLICLGCHNKEGWAGSAHAHPAVADEHYQSAAAQLREFPDNTQVWRAACLNCHDPHTVQGSRRLLREGTDGPVTVTNQGARYKQGGNPAIEEVCWACHSADGAVLQGQIDPSNNPAFQVPDIKTDFTTMARHMPIQSADQPAGYEVHSIGSGPGDQPRRGQDFLEDPNNLGKTDLTNRHAECTDCHNPHRVMKNRLFNSDNSTPHLAGTHAHTPAQLAEAGQTKHTNLASGVLRGIWGVEPQYGSTAFGSAGVPATFEVKRGDPGVNPNTDVSASYLTREYQICFKCHSNYAYGNDVSNTEAGNGPPLLGSFSGGTPYSTNVMKQYTNQAMEYQSPTDHMAEGTSGSPTGAYDGSSGCSVTNASTESGINLTINGTLDHDGNCTDWRNDNHRSWHPAVRETGRTPAVRKADANDWRSPFNLAVGEQTMYCTDCHGSSTAPDTVVPNGGEDGYPWGPHGSNDNFLLKGGWSDQTGVPAAGQNDLCFRCHQPDQYRPTAVPGVVQLSGFRMALGSGSGCLSFKLTNLHVAHATGVNGVVNFRCTYCHIAVPHGWKNKAFLANLNDVGLEAPLLAGEAGSADSRQVRYTGAPQGTGRYYNGPYYNGAVLKVRKFARSGEWLDVNCGSSGTPGNGIAGVSWMNNNSETCRSLP
ncbi:MAG: hypothetical protein HY940_10210 [Gammaproteobacteria bacterium]|nr:hypothetical protein [Gammaproteobacteria bacterium]